MLNISKYTFSLIIGFASLTCPAEEVKSEKVIQKIAFGACASQNKPQPIWDAVVKEKPDLFLFLGDNIYGDTENMAIMRKKYAQLKAKPGYQKLLQTCPILATWDDHDYGKNDGGQEYPMKKESAKEFLDFFQVPEDSPRRKREGIYGSQIFGQDGKTVQVILLDTRYFRSTPLLKSNLSKEEKKKQNIVGWYRPHTDKSTTMLGEEQWNWLEQQLLKKADVRIIASSIQVVSYEKRMECWGNLPHERQKLFDLIGKTKANGVVFISGDVHFSEISLDKSGPYPLYDHTSSGLTNVSAGWARAVNNYRLGKSYAKLNFGLITIDWQANKILLETKSIKGDSAIKHEIALSSLSVK